MRQQSEFLQKASIVVMCIFYSTPENVARYQAENKGDETLVLGDAKGVVYKCFHVKRSVTAPLFTSFEVFSNMKKYKKFMPSQNAEIPGPNGLKKIQQLPADFCIDENGIVVDVFRAKRATDHMTIDRIEAFIPEDKRCKCKKGDCLFPKCREMYEQIKRDSMAMLYLGDVGDEDGGDE